MLDKLRDFPIDIVNILTQDYSNGILTGCDIAVEEDKILVKPGIIVFDKNIYFIKEELSIKYSSNEKLTVLKMRLHKRKNSPDFFEFKGEIFLDEDVSTKSHEFELCRFKLRHKARLRIEHESFEDLSTYYNTVNIINTQYSAPEESTVSPYISSNFAKEMFKYKLEDPFDISFCMLCLNEKRIQRSLIRQYINSRLSINRDKFSNEEIYKYLLDILLNVRGSKRRDGIRDSLHQKIMIG
ncbi:hypothetical protein [Wukongibacter baidiensis]